MIVYAVLLTASLCAIAALFALGWNERRHRLERRQDGAYWRGAMVRHCVGTPVLAEPDREEQ